MRVIFFCLSALTITGASFAAPPDRSVCRAAQPTPADWQKCAASAPKVSLDRQLALMNLGSIAFEKGDLKSAVKLYDEARPPNGKRLLSDVIFHANRAAAYHHVGRNQEAMADARFALNLIDKSATAANGSIFAVKIAICLTSMNGYCP